MDKNLSCNQVMALVNFYIEGKLSPKLNEYVELHLQNCPRCKKKVDELAQIYEKYKSKELSLVQNKQNKLDKEFYNNLSAYVDNELNINDNFKIKKMTISNPQARHELEMMYRYKKIMQMSFERTKINTKNDYSKNIIAKVQEAPEYSTTYFYKLAILFFLLIFSILTCFVYLYL